MLNKAIIMGRLTADPELKHTTSNIAVATFTLAVNRSYAKPGTERQADFIDIVAWRATAEFVCRYFKKGSMMAVDGSIQTRTYTDNQGVKRKAFEIVADNVNFCESKSASSGGTSTGASGFEAPPMPVAFESGSSDDFSVVPGDDDLPF